MIERKTEIEGKKREKGTVLSQTFLCRMTSACEIQGRRYGGHFRPAHMRYLYMTPERERERTRDT